jgi:hypothetical protein
MALGARSRGGASSMVSASRRASELQSCVVDLGGREDGVRKRGWGCGREDGMWTSGGPYRSLAGAGVRC